MKNISLLLSIIIFLCLINKNSFGISIELKNDENEIFIVSHGWHTGFVVPLKAVKEKIPELENRFRRTQLLEIGWGEKDFYQSNDFSLTSAASAILWPTDSVMHVVSIPKKVEKFFPNSKVVKICLREKQFSSLILFISNGFFRDKNGNIEELQKGLYGNSQFYKGVDDFHLMNTCNIWVAKGLQSAGLEISTTYKLTASSVMDYLTEIKKKKDFSSYFDCNEKLN